MPQRIIPSTNQIGDGYVYFIQAGYTGPIKIGVTGNVSSRIAELQVGNHMMLMLIAAIGPFNREKAEFIEKSLHKKFKHKHVRGEWFSRTIDLSSVAELDIGHDEHFSVSVVG